MKPPGQYLNSLMKKSFLKYHHPQARGQWFLKAVGAGTVAPKREDSVAASYSVAASKVD